MFFHLLILGFACGVAVINQVDLLLAYQQFIDWLAVNHVTICGQFLVAMVGLVFLALLLERLRAFSLMRLVARLLLELSLLAATTISLSALFFQLALERNLWHDLRSAVLVPFLGMLAAVTIYYLFDFNYQCRYRLAPVLLLTATSMGLLASGLLSF